MTELITEDQIRKMTAVLERQQGKDVGILVAQNDPDAIACAIGFSPVIKAHQGNPRIFHAGGFGHPQNKILYDEFELMKSFTHIREMPPDIPCVLVDSSRLEDNRFGTEIDPGRFIGIIDHHLEKIEETDDLFVILRSCGAAATLVKLVADRLGLELDEELSTLLAIGIMADTDKLTHPITKHADREVHNDLMRKGDQGLLAKCFSYTLPEHYKDIYAEVLRTEEVVQSVRIAHPEHLLNEDDGDLLSIIADDLLKLEDASSVVVWGIPVDHVRASVRARKLGTGMGKLIDAVFGEGGGGCKHGAGGARVGLNGILTPCAKTASDLISFLDAHFKERVRSHKGRPEKEPADSKS